jgi:hypothetical protein
LAGEGACVSCAVRVVAGRRHGLITQLERQEATEARDREAVHAWLCGSKYGLIAQMERAQESAADAVHACVYGARSGLIAKVRIDSSHPACMPELTPPLTPHRTQPAS